MKTNYTYFTITGEFAPETLIERLGFRPDQILPAGGKLPTGKTVEKPTLVFGINDDTKTEVTERMHASIKALIPKEELLAELKVEFGLQYYLEIADWDKGELLIVPFEVSRFLYVSKTFIDLDYYTF